MKIKYGLTFLMVLLASILPDLLITSPYVTAVKLVMLAAGAIFFLLIRPLRPLGTLSAVLLTINASFWVSALIRHAFWWKRLYADLGFFADVAGSVFVKIIGIVPVAAVMLLLMKSPQKCYLSPGNLSIRADSIVWLGIRGDRIRWRKLAVVSGVLIMTGTIFLSMVTTTGFSNPTGFSRLIQNLPLILLLAVINSFCEGLIFRSAVMGPIHDMFPKLFVTLMPAIFFGIAHYQGIPGGFLGASLSGLLGYYMALSMYETRGFLSGWIIHVMQDVAVFSTLAIMGT